MLHEMNQRPRGTSIIARMDFQEGEDDALAAQVAESDHQELIRDHSRARTSTSVMLGKGEA